MGSAEGSRSPITVAWTTSPRMLGGFQDGSAPGWLWRECFGLGEQQQRGGLGAVSRGRLGPGWAAVGGGSAGARQRYITVLEDSSGPVWTSMQTADSEDDGDCGKSKPPLSARRRRPTSSSELDSDQEWQRYQEAAVSAADILKQSAFSVMPPDSSQVHKQECTEHNQKKKKKRKKKAKGEHNSEQKTEGGDQISNETLSSIDRKCKRQEGKCIEDTTLPRVVKKKKKITRKEANDDSVL
nr:protein CUSTOS isoform X2 [Chrysemys picta bellii]